MFQKLLSRYPFFKPLSISFLTLICLFLNESAFAQKPVVLSNTTLINRIDSYVGVYIDSTSSLSFDSILSNSYQEKFKTYSKESLLFGYLAKPIWLKIDSKTTQGDDTDWLLELPAPFLERIEFYQVENGRWTSNICGYFLPHAQRSVSHTGFAWPIVFDSTKTSTLYLRISGEGPKGFPLYIMDRGTFTEKNRLEDLGYGIFFGILLVMFFYNLFIYLSLRQINYLLYIGTIMLSILIFSSATGYAGKYLWPDSPLLNFYAGRFTLGLLCIVLSIFATRFLDTKVYSRTIYYLVLSLIPLGILAIFLVATGIMPGAGNHCISLTTLVLITASIVTRVKGNKVAHYFIAAWTLYLIGGLMLTLRNAGVLPFNFWTTHLPEIGAIGETIIIAFALGDRYRRYKEEKEEAQQNALQIQQQANEQLESTVADRTRQLTEVVDELNLTLEANLKQTKLIENKNAELDAFFYGVSHDLKSPIASLQSLTTLAKSEISNEQAQEYFTLQLQQIERVKAMLSDLITITKIDHSPLQKETIDFETIVQDTINSFSGLPGFSNIQFSVVIDPTLHYTAEWIYVNNIIQNLIENAIKYSKEISPYVKVDIAKKETSIWLSVEDNGHGIQEAYQARIFDMFYRATSSSSGSGLGLYILKKSLAKLGGTIDVQSEVGKGSKFSIQLPA